MNCTTFAQHLGAHPDSLDESMREHATSCAACSALQAELTRFDSVLRAALDVDVPAGLGQVTAPVISEETSDNVVSLHERATASRSATSDAVAQKPRMSTPLFAVAATLLLSVGVFFGNILGKHSSAQLSQAIVAHVEHEPSLLQGEWSVVQTAQLTSVLQTGRVSLNGDIGTVRHAGLCSFRGNKVAHVVVQSTNGPVTVMLLPEEKTNGITSFDEEGYRGVLIPVGEGSIAVISDSEESTNEVRKNFTDKVAWSI